jgi:hypothetical protein
VFRSSSPCNKSTIIKIIYNYYILIIHNEDGRLQGQILLLKISLGTSTNFYEIMYNMALAPKKALQPWSVVTHDADTELHGFKSARKDIRHDKQILHRSRTS